MFKRIQFPKIAMHACVCLGLLFLCFALQLNAEETVAAAASDGQQASSVAVVASDGQETSSFADQIQQGGTVVIILILISVALVTCAIERLVQLRRRKFIEPGLANEARRMWAAGEHNMLVKKCSEQTATLSRIIAVLATHRHVSPMEASGLAGDIASQDMRLQMQKIIPFALIATISPLLGLLGTVSGMIDSFEMVSLAGSLGNASILADGISHALVTTAAGLIVAVPAIACFNIFKIMTNKLTLHVEIEVNQLINEWFLSDHGTDTGEAA